MSLCCSLLCMIPICFTSTPPPILGDRKFLTFLKNTFFHYDSMPMHPLLTSHLPLSNFPHIPPRERPRFFWLRWIATARGISELFFFLRAAQRLRSYGPFTDGPCPRRGQARGPGHRASSGACPNQKRKWSRSSIEFAPKLGLMAGCAGVRIYRQIRAGGGGRGRRCDSK